MFVVIDSHVAEHKVKTGLMTATAVAVETGLAPGETVVARAGSFLRPGDLVRIAKNSITLGNWPTTV